MEPPAENKYAMVRRIFSTDALTQFGNTEKKSGKSTADNRGNKQSVHTCLTFAKLNLQKRRQKEFKGRKTTVQRQQPAWDV
jgi:hypothetical protein